MDNKTSISIYFSKWLSLIPLFIFIIGAMYLGLNGSPDEYGFWPIMICSMIVAMLLSKNKDVFANIVVKGMSDKLVIIMVMAWLLSGIIGVFISKTGLIETIINIYLQTGLGGGFFLVAIFIIAAITGTSTGTAVGTVLIVTPVLFKAGISLDIDPYLLLGAILSGGAFGDDFSPLSDTTIAVASTQNINIGFSVKSRLKYALTAAIPAMLLFYIMGGSNIRLNSEITIFSYKPLFMLLSPAIVILLCLRGKHILSALLFGILTAILISLTFSLISPEQIFSLDKENFTAHSILIEGMKKGVGISIFSIFLIGLVSFVLSVGIIENIVNFISKHFIKKSYGELIIVSLTVIINSILAHNTITIMSIGSLVKKVSDKLKINSYRAGNLLDISGNTVMHIFPYMITVILVTSIGNELTDEKLNPFKVGLHNFHSIFLLILAITVSIFGIWRKRDERFMINNEITNANKVYKQ